MRFCLTSWQLMLLCVVVGTGLVLVGCADPPPTPTAVWSAATAAAGEVAGVDPTQTLVPTATPAPTRTPTLVPTATSTPSPTSTPTPSPSPTWTPSPTLQPSAQLEAAQRHQINGEYEQAAAAYLALLADDPAADQAREAQYRLAESYLLGQRYADAAAAWESFIDSYPDDARLPEAILMAARSYHQANQCTGAIVHYQASLSRGTVLADLVYDWMGDCLAGEDRLEEAITAYRMGAEATENRSLRVGLGEKIAGIYLSQEDYAAAVAEYDAILSVARVDEYRAKIEYLAGRALAAAGQVQDAYVRYERAVNRYPEAEYAYLSLVELVNAGVPVDEFQRGLIDYHAGAGYPDAYGAAIAAFDRYLASEPIDKADAAVYYKALALRALEQPDAALKSLESLIAGYPESQWLVRAWREKGVTLAGLGQNDAAVKAWQDLAAFFPDSELAPDALWRAARLRERAADYVGAATLFEELQRTFPGFEDADEALWRAGLARYRLGEEQAAVADWQALLEGYTGSPYRPKTLYWLGKVGAKDESGGEGDYWDRLLAADPNAYYALRVRQIRAGGSLTASRLITAAVEAPVWEAAQAEQEILTWLRGWTAVPTATVQLSLPATVTRRLDFRRGEALLAANLRPDAIGAYDGVRAAAWRDPLMLAQLSLYLREKGLHGLAARTAYRLAQLWPKGTVRDAPVALQRLAYPLVYGDLLSAEASARNLDPLLLAALIRQESLFEPVAVSSAGARGLGQVMPATGEGIARNLGMEGFVLDDLYRPFVSVRFGAYYLAVQMGRFDNQILIGLAAYNGGPGNTMRWLEGINDLDLFVEAITATQSRLYLQRVYEQYLIYEEVYRPVEGVD